MAALTLQQIFGSNSYLSVTPSDEYAKLGVNLFDFQNDNQGGDIQNGLGISDLNEEPTPYTDNTSKGINLFYALMLLIMQNQASGKNDDPEQKIHIAQSGVSVVNFGSRTGQLERKFTVSIFSDGEFSNTADIDSI